MARSKIAAIFVPAIRRDVRLQQSCHFPNCGTLECCNLRLRRAAGSQYAAILCRATLQDPGLRQSRFAQNSGNLDCSKSNLPRRGGKGLSPHFGFSHSREWLESLPSALKPIGTIEEKKDPTYTTPGLITTLTIYN